jgi:hypothetical protein
VLIFLCDFRESDPESGTRASGSARNGLYWSVQNDDAVGINALSASIELRRFGEAE